MIKTIFSTFCFLFVGCLFALASPPKPDIWVITDLSGFKINQPIHKALNKKASQFNSLTDTDDYVAMSIFLMNSNKFNLVRIVVGSTSANPKESIDVLKVFNDWFIPAYSHDVTYWNSKKGPGGFLSSKEMFSRLRKSSIQGKSFQPEKSYKDFNTLPKTVQELVSELKKEKYSKKRPLYISVWGPTTEVAMAVKHFQENKNYQALERLYLVSHWTTSFLRNMKRPLRCVDLEAEPEKIKFKVSNCDRDCQACMFLHNEAKQQNAHFRYADLGSIGQLGIVDGSANFFQPGGLQSTNAQDFYKSEMGKMFISSKFKEEKPDGSDCASFFTILGTYGITLSDFNSDGQLTKQEELNGMNVYKKNAPEILQDLLDLSNIVAKQKNP